MRALWTTSLRQPVSRVVARATVRVAQRRQYHHVVRRCGVVLERRARARYQTVPAVPAAPACMVAWQLTATSGAAARRHFAASGGTMDGSLFTQELPSLGDSITEGDLLSWSKDVGDWVDVDDVVAVVESEKLAVDITAHQAGVIVERKAEEGDTLNIGDPVFVIDTAAEKPAAAAAPPAPAAAAPVEDAPTTAATAAAALAPTPAPASVAAAPAPPAPAAAPGSRVERRVPLKKLRKTIAKRLKMAQNTAALLTTFNEIDMTNLMQLRAQYKDEFLAKHGVKLGFMSAFVKACSTALMDNPTVNAFMDEDAIVYRDYVDISVAVATPRGLQVPVVRNCESLSFAGVEQSIMDLAIKGRDNKLAPEDSIGGTFTISNGGVYGSMMGTPIVNPPQSAILGMHNIVKRPVAIGDEVKIRPMMYLALTYDHRLLDGKDAVMFLVQVKNILEDPRRLLLDL